ncbi:MAG: ATP synthase F1 subunit gamma [Proteobacteria bacterium]|nr:ATP synthase F1 subunit gamma [Pseudomonadota bacterium]
MPALKDIRRRIASVKSTQKITRAMKLVAAAKLRRAQGAIVGARPYARKVAEIVAELALRAERTQHPLLADREPQRVLLVVLSADRGLCGAFNTNIIRATEHFREQLSAAGQTAQLVVVGRKGRDYYRYRRVALEDYLPGVDTNSAIPRAEALAALVSDHFISGQVDRVCVVYTAFKSAMSQAVAVEQLLPVVPAARTGGDEAPLDFLYEPSERELLATMLPIYVRVELQRAALEAIASEHGARMTAMENATTNAAEMARSLTLEYNKARQTSITKELLEIIAGAEALR